MDWEISIDEGIMFLVVVVVVAIGGREKERERKIARRWRIDTPLCSVVVVSQVFCCSGIGGIDLGVGKKGWSSISFQGDEREI